MADDKPIPESDASGSDPAPETAPEEPQSLSDTEADIKEFLGSEQPQGETRINLDSRQRGRRA